MRRLRVRKILERRIGSVSLKKRKTNSSPSPLSLRAAPQAPLTPWEGHILSVCLSPTPNKGPKRAGMCPGRSLLQPSAWHLVRAQQRPTDGLTTGHQRFPLSITTPSFCDPCSITFFFRSFPCSIPEPLIRSKLMQAAFTHPISRNPYKTPERTEFLAPFYR